MMVSLIAEAPIKGAGQQDKVSHMAAPVVRSVVRAEKTVTGEARA